MLQCYFNNTIKSLYKQLFSKKLFSLTLFFKYNPQVEFEFNRFKKSA